MASNLELTWYGKDEPIRIEHLPKGLFSCHDIDIILLQCYSINIHIGGISIW